jgi:hypothetical protein
MKIRLNNYTDEDVMPYLDLAAKVIHGVHVNVSVTVRFHRINAWRARSTCWWDARRIRLILPRRDTFSAYERDTLGYFHQHQIPLHVPYSIATWEENLVRVAAHEFAHMTPAGHNHRKSKIELFCEKKAAEAIKLLRSEDGQAFIRDYHKGDHERAKARAAKAQAKAEYQSSTEGKRDRLIAAQKRWQTKAKRAGTALRKLERQLRRLDRITAAQGAQQ